MGRQSSRTKIRTRKERILRYVFRRRPCVFILFSEISLLLIFITIWIICVLQYIRLRRQNLIFKTQDDLLKKIDSYITFAHCDYMPAEDFNMDFCETRIREESYAYRHFSITDDETDKTCIDRQEQVSCHEELDEFNSLATWVFSFDENPFELLNQCPGLLRTSMPYSTFFEDIIAFFPEHKRLRRYKGRYVLAQELVAKCPQCSVRTRQFPVQTIRNGVSHNICYVKLKTIKKGWPAIAEECDDVNHILHGSDECEDADIVDNEQLVLIL